MAKKKTKKKEKVEIQEIKVDLIHLDVYFAIKSIRVHHRAGMRAYNNAKDMKLSLEQWDMFFKNY